MHSFFGMSGSMSISADATCQGLQSPTVGVSTMKLEKGNTFIAPHLFVINLYENEKKLKIIPVNWLSHLIFQLDKRTSSKCTGIELHVKHKIVIIS